MLQGRSVELSDSITAISAPEKLAGPSSQAHPFPNHPRGKEPVSLTKEERRERKTKTEANLELLCICLKAQGRESRFYAEAPWDPRDGNLKAAVGKHYFQGGFNQLEQLFDRQGC